MKLQFQANAQAMEKIGKDQSNRIIAISKTTDRDEANRMVEDFNRRSKSLLRLFSAAVRDACPDYFKPVVTCAYYTAWRKEEILSLRWNQVDLQGEEIRLEVGTDKNDAGRVIAMHGELMETLQAQWERRKVVQIPGQSPALLCQYVFHKNGKLIGGKNGDVRDVWHQACIAAGSGQMVEVKRKGKRVKVYRGKLFHDFRRTGVRDMIRAGVQEGVAMKISGHKTRSMLDRYNIVSPNDLREAARRRSTYTQELVEKARKVVAMKNA